MELTGRSYVQGRAQEMSWMVQFEDLEACKRSSRLSADLHK